jgi:hypothetical protein
VGTVTVAGKQLVKGDTIQADAIIDTGPDGGVVIELAHNLVHLELGPNKHVKVNESLAWRQPRRVEPTTTIDQATASGGRPVERNAADTAVTADPNATGSGRGDVGAPSGGGSGPDKGSGETIVQGALDPGIIKKVVKENGARFRQCYESGAKNNPSLAGKVSVKLTIDKTGAVIAAEETSGAFPDKAVVSCILDVFKTLKFPKPGGMVIINYPLMFKPAE